MQLLAVLDFGDLRQRVASVAPSIHLVTTGGHRAFIGRRRTAAVDLSNYFRFVATAVAAVAVLTEGDQLARRVRELAEAEALRAWAVQTPQRASGPDA